VAPRNGSASPRPGGRVNLPKPEVTRAIGEAKTLTDLKTAIDLAGADSSTVELTIKQVVRVHSVTERTIRRYISSGRLIPREVATANGKQHLFTVADLLAVFEVRADLIDRARSNPIEDLAGNVALMTAGFNDVIKAQQSEAQELRAIIEAQGRIIEELRAEQRDTRAQIHQLHETTVKALMPPARRSWLDRVLKREKG
jgi:DNA-binding transcriptional MerR regulator